MDEQIDINVAETESEASQIDSLVNQLDSDFDEFGPSNVTKTNNGFSIQFPWAQQA